MILYLFSFQFFRLLFISLPATVSVARFTFCVCLGGCVRACVCLCVLRYVWYLCALYWGSQIISHWGRWHVVIWLIYWTKLWWMLKGTKSLRWCKWDRQKGWKTVTKLLQIDSLFPTFLWLPMTYMGSHSLGWTQNEAESFTLVHTAYRVLECIS